MRSTFNTQRQSGGPFSVELTVPFNEEANTLFNRRLRSIADRAMQLADISIGDRHVSCLHRLPFDECSFAKLLFEHSNKPCKLDRLVVSNVVNTVERGAVAQLVLAAARRLLHHTDHPLDNIVNIRKIAQHLPAIINLDRTPLENALAELEDCHIRTTPRTINRKEAEARDGHVVEMGIHV